MPALKSPLALPVVLGVLIAFLSPVLVDVSIGSALAYLLWSMVWWLLGVGLVRRFHRAGAFTTASLGAVVGIMAQLGNWALWQAVQLPAGTVAGGVVAAIVGVVLLRTSRSAVDDVPSAEQPLEQPTAELTSQPPRSTVWLWTALTGFMALAFAGFSERQVRPPGMSTMYQDLYWHLGIVAELKRSLLPQVPQAQAGHLNYHWLSDAYMASGSLGTFTPTTDVGLRLWVLPVVSLTLALGVVVAKRLSGSWVAGNVAMITMAAPASVTCFGWMTAGPSSSFVWLSPSQIFGLVFALWAVYLFAPVLRGAVPGPATVALMLVTVFLCAGAKSSILPVFCGGAALVFLLFLKRREARRGAFIVGALCVVGIAMAMPLFAGGSAGSKIRMLSSVRRSSAYRTYTGMDIPLDHGPFVMPYVATGAVFVITVGLLVALVLLYGHVSVAAALGRTWREDPVPTFLAGSFLASLVAYELIDHTGMSQAYFPLGALPLLALLTGWGFSAAWHRAEPASRWKLTAIGVVVGGVIVSVSRAVTGHRVPAKHSLPVAVIVPILVVLAVIAASVVLMRRKPALGAALLLGLGCVYPAWATAKNAGSALTLPPMAQQKWSVLPAESAAAGWLRDHSEADALVATNVHCRKVVTSKGCDSRAYWVSAFTERRMLVESWGYMDQSQKAAGAHGLPATKQPYYDQTLYMLNENTFHAPTRERVDALKKRGVTWLFGDERASAVSPDLAKFATLEHSDGPVRIYKLK